MYINLPNFPLDDVEAIGHILLPPPPPPPPSNEKNSLKKDFVDLQLFFS